MQTKEKEIGGRKVMSTELSARRAYKLAPKLGAVIIPTLAELDGVDVSKPDEIEVTQIVPALSKLFQSLSDADADAILEQGLQSTQVFSNGHVYDLSNPENIDLAFGTDVRALIETLWFAITVSFGNFLDGSSLASLAGAPAGGASVSE